MKLNKILWTTRNVVYKAKIRIEDRTGLYSYQKWFSENEGNAERQPENKQHNQHPNDQPLITFLVPVPHGKDYTQHLEDTLAAIRSQTFQNWEILLSCEFTQDDMKKQVLESLSSTDDRIHLQTIEHGEKVSDPAVSAVSSASGDYVLLVNPGDIPAPALSFEIASFLNDSTRPDMIYFDEDCLDRHTGSRRDPFFKPDWSPELMLSINYLVHAACRRQMLSQII